MSQPDLTSAWLRERFATTPEVADLDPGKVSPDATPAAVLIPVVQRPTGLTVLLTQRTTHLNDHAGQVSFPGGRSEEGDRSAVDTALREAWEEVGIEPAQVEVLGSMPQYWTGTGFRVTPVIGILSPPLNLKLDDFEVAEVFEPPLGFLLDQANWRRDSIEYQGQTRHFWAMPWNDHYIWGATAAMLVNFQRWVMAA